MRIRRVAASLTIAILAMGGVVLADNMIQGLQTAGTANPTRPVLTGVADVTTLRAAAGSPEGNAYVTLRSGSTTIGDANGIKVQGNAADAAAKVGNSVPIAGVGPAGLANVYTPVCAPGQTTATLTDNVFVVGGIGDNSKLRALPVNRDAQTNASGNFVQIGASDSIGTGHYANVIPTGTTASATPNVLITGGMDTANNTQPLLFKASIPAGTESALVSRPITDDRTASGTMTLVNDTVQIALAGRAGAAVTLTGTWTGTVTFEASYDNAATWVTAIVGAQSGSSSSGSQTSNGAFSFATLGGATHVRTRFSTASSGTVSVYFAATMNPGQSAPSGNAGGDGSSARNGLFTQSQALVFNGATWDRQRGNDSQTALASAARTATTQSATLTNFNGRGLVILLDVTVNAGQINSIEVQTLVGATWKTVYQFAAINVSTVTQKAYCIYPGSASAASWDAAPIQGIIPRTFRVQATHNDASSITYSVSIFVQQ